MEVVRKLEEKERILLAQIASMEKEVALRTQGMESYKRKAVEATQQTNDLKLHLDKYVSQIRDAQSIVADKTSAWQNEMFKTKRLHEDLQSYKRKYERAKKFEMATTADEVLQVSVLGMRFFICQFLNSFSFSGGNSRAEGGVDLSQLQDEAEGRRAEQVLPRLLLRLPEDAVRDAPAEVPQVQPVLQCQ